MAHHRYSLDAVTWHASKQQTYPCVFYSVMHPDFIRCAHPLRPHPPPASAPCPGSLNCRLADQPTTTCRAECVFVTTTLSVVILLSVLCCAGTRFSTRTDRATSLPGSSGRSSGSRCTIRSPGRSTSPPRSTTASVMGSSASSARRPGRASPSPGKLIGGDAPEQQTV